MHAFKLLRSHFGLKLICHMNMQMEGGQSTNVSILAVEFSNKQMNSDSAIA